MMLPGIADTGLGAGCYLETIADAHVAPSRIHGLGLFSLRSRTRGELVCRLDGQEINPDAWPAILFTLEWNAVSEDRLLVRGVRTSYGFVNHNRAPNLQIDSAGRLVRALTDLAAGDELTLDYTKQPLPKAYLADPRAAYLAGG